MKIELLTLLTCSYDIFMCYKTQSWGAGSAMAELFHAGTAVDQSHGPRQKQSFIHHLSHLWGGATVRTGEARWSYKSLFCKLNFTIFRTMAETCCVFVCWRRNVDCSLQPDAHLLITHSEYEPACPSRPAGCWTTLANVSLPRYMMMNVTCWQHVSYGFRVLMMKVTTNVPQSSLTDSEAADLRSELLAAWRRRCRAPSEPVGGKRRVFIELTSK